MLWTLSRCVTCNVVNVHAPPAVHHSSMLRLRWSVCITIGLPSLDKFIFLAVSCFRTFFTCLWSASLRGSELLTPEPQVGDACRSRYYRQIASIICNLKLASMNTVPKTDPFWSIYWLQSRRKWWNRHSGNQRTGICDVTQPWEHNVDFKLGWLAHLSEYIIS